MRALAASAIVAVIGTSVGACAISDALFSSEDRNQPFPGPDSGMTDAPPVGGICSNTEDLGVVTNSGLTKTVFPCDNPVPGPLDFQATCGSDGSGVGMVMEADVSSPGNYEVCVRTFVPQVWSFAGFPCFGDVEGICPTPGAGSDCLTANLSQGTVTIYWEALLDDCPSLDVEFRTVGTSVDAGP